MPFAQWLQSKMEQHSFSNYRIAKMAGVHQSTVAGWLAGSKPQAEKEKTVRLAIEDYEISIGVKTDSPEIKKETSGQSESLSQKDIALIKWFRSLPAEKQKAILIAQDAPENLVE